MAIYILRHFCAESENALGGVKMLGCYSDLTNIKIAIKKYNRICGFSMYPHGFCWHKCIALGNVDQECDHVYLAEVYMHDKKYEFEYDELLGVFWKSADAESCLSEFKSDNYDTSAKKLKMAHCLRYFLSFILLYRQCGYSGRTGRGDSFRTVQ